MLIKPIKTHAITRKDKSITHILKQYIKTLTDKTVVVITSKIVSICEGRMIPIGLIDKQTLIKNECYMYIPCKKSKYNITLTLSNQGLMPASGIDESNGNGLYVLWPKNPQKSANMIREYLVKQFKLRNIGVVISDSKTTPLRWGTTGYSIAHSGFNAVKKYQGTPDIFGRPFLYQFQHIADGLAAAANVVMGEGAERNPIAIISDIPQIEFQYRNPTIKELKSIKINLKDDIYEPMLTAMKWHKGEAPH